MMGMIIKEFYVKNSKIQCLLEQTRPTVIADGKSFQDVRSLIQAVPALKSAEALPTLATIINFLARGLEFRFIDNIGTYAAAYQKRLRHEHQTTETSPDRISDYGTFDTKIMHQPALKDDRLTFFVENDYNNLPYMVSVSHPFTPEHMHISYQLLPYSSH